MQTKELGLILLIALLAIGMITTSYPYTTSQFVDQTTDLNETLYFNGVYDGNLLIFDGNKLNVISSADFNNALVPASADTNAQTACNAGEYLSGDGTCTSGAGLGLDTNYETAGYTIGQLLLDTNFETAGLLLNDVNNVWGRSGNNIFNLNSGNVGIGTASPTVFVAGSTALEVANAGNKFPSIAIQRTGATSLYVDTLWRFFPDATGGLRLRHNDSSDEITIDNSGNVGIGNSDPEQALDVAGTYVRFRTSSGNEDRHLFYNGGSTNSAFYSIYDLNETLQVRLNSSGVSYFNGGNVGIGTASPDYTLDVAGSFRVDPSDNVNIRFNRNTIEQKNQILWQTNDVTNWFTGLTDRGNFGDGTQFFIGTGNGGATPTLLLETDKSVKLPNDNQKLYFGAGDDASITYDGTNMLLNPKEVGSGVVYVDGNISVEGLIYHSQVDDSNDALEWFKDGSLLKNPDGTTNDQAFQECYTSLEITDFNRPEIEVYDVNNCVIPTIEKCNIVIDTNYVWNGSFYDKIDTNTLVCEQINVQECNQQTCEYKEVIDGNVSLGFEKVCNNYCVDIQPICETETKERTIYPHTKVRDGIDGECLYAKQNQALALLNEAIDVEGELVDLNIVFAEAIYTKSKVPDPSVDYCGMIMEADIYDKENHYAYKEVRGKFVLDAEKRWVVLEGCEKQKLLEMCVFENYKYSWCGIKP